MIGSDLEELFGARSNNDEFGGPGVGSPYVSPVDATLIEHLDGCGLRLGPAVSGLNRILSTTILPRRTASAAAPRPSRSSRSR